ncbi:MAG: hypothetical protein WAW13_00515 [Minisyncoccia bacterium]
MSALLGFITSPLGRWIGVALAVLALLAGVHHHGVTQGRDREKASQAARVERARKDVARREAKAATISETARSDLTRETVRIQTRTITLIKEVPVYVSPAADARAVIPVGFVRLHDAAAGQTVVPGAPGGSLDTDSGLSLSAVASTVVENYGTCHAITAEAVTWRRWYADQKAAWDAPAPR